MQAVTEEKQSEVSYSENDSKIDADANFSVHGSEKGGASDQMENDFRKLESRKKNPNDLSGILNKYKDSSVKKDEKEEYDSYVLENDHTNIHNHGSQQRLEYEFNNVQNPPIEDE